MQQMRNDLSNDISDSLQKSIFEERLRVFLFDIISYVCETHDLVHYPKYGKVLAKILREMDSDILRSSNVMVVSEHEKGLISKAGTPYEFQLDKSKYPFKKKV